jgi:aminoglycoside phosphotransferase family enzyme
MQHHLRFSPRRGGTADLAWQQQNVVDFLSRGASYGFPGAQVDRIVTHCSVIFLVRDRAYKLKRAIRFAALDYTTESLRRRACRAELALNRRTAPDLYLAVRSINHGDDGSLAFDGPGAPVDHVVVMRRFAQTDQFDRMAQAGRLTPELMRALGHGIAHFHLAAAATRAHGGRHAILQGIDENDRELALVAHVLGARALSAHRGRTIARLETLAPLLDRRRDQGFVRRCHGDLRLANICLFGGQPTLFDCIEFSDELSCIDVLYDLAFLLMDLHVRGYGNLAALVLSSYHQKAGQTDEFALLPLFLSMRAATRSWALAGGAQRQSDANEAERRLTLARRYLAASYRFLRASPAWLAACLSNPPAA